MRKLFVAILMALGLLALTNSAWTFSTTSANPQDPNALQFIWVGNSQGQFTDPEFTYMAENDEYVIMAAPHARWDITKHHEAAIELKTRNPQIEVFPYFNIKCWNRNFQFGQDVMNAHEVWYLHDSSGSRIPRRRDGSGGYYVDPRNADYRAFALGIIQDWMGKAIPGGSTPIYAGIALDAASFYSANDNSDVFLYYNKSELDAGLSRLIMEIQQTLQSLGQNQKVLDNGVLFSLPLFSYVDIAMNENFCFNAFTTLALQNKAPILKSIDQMQNANYAGKVFLQKANISKGPGQDVTDQERRQLQRFCYGSFLLGHRPGYTFFKYGENGAEAGERLYTVPGEIENLQGINLNPPEPGIPLGNPLDKYRTDGLVLKRSFEKALVYVNMEDTAQTVTLTDTLVLMNGDQPAEPYNPGDAFAIPTKDAAFFTIPSGAPTISHTTDQTTTEDKPITVAFTIGDDVTSAENLILSVAASNQALVPNSNLVLGGSGAGRTLTITPAPNQSGITSIVISVTDEDKITSSDTFTVAVTPVNDPPVVSPIPDQTTNEDTPITVNFTVGDSETPPGDLRVTAVWTNYTLIPMHNITLGGSDANRTATIYPRLDQHGTLTITINVSDRTVTTSRSFLLTVAPVNDPPAISSILDRTTNEDTPISVPFTVRDIDSPLGGLVLSATSSNTALVPNTAANMSFITGTGGYRRIKIVPAPNQDGTTEITVSVSDGGASATTTFQLTVNPVNDTPTISGILHQYLKEDTSLTVAFTVGDVETPVGSLNVTAISDNPTLVPDSGMVLGGSDANRTLTITPALNQSGQTRITLTVNDGQLSASKNFLLTVYAVNDPPTISNIPDQTTTQGAPIAIPFTVGDVETAPEALIVTGSSSNTILVSSKSNMIFQGTDAERTLIITPALHQTGTVTITLKVSDGALVDRSTFVLTVNP